MKNYYLFEMLVYVKNHFLEQNYSISTSLKHLSLNVWKYYKWILKDMDDDLQTAKKYIIKKTWWTKV